MFIDTQEEAVEWIKKPVLKEIKERPTTTEEDERNVRMNIRLNTTMWKSFISRPDYVHVTKRDDNYHYIQSMHKS